MTGVQTCALPISICLDNVWGSIFSYEKGRFLWKMPRYFPYPVTVSYGKPMPPTATPFEVRQAVQELNTDAWKHRKKLMMPIHRAFVRKARHHPLRFFMADTPVRRSATAREGARVYDFYGYVGPGRPDHPYDRFSRFKEKFGGRPVRRVGSRDVFFYDRLAAAALAALRQGEPVC